MKLKRSMYHSQPKGPTVGKDVQIAKFAVGRYETNLLPKPPGGYTKQFGTDLQEALQVVIQPNEGIQPTGNIGQATWDVLEKYLDEYRRWQYRMWKLPTIPAPDPAPNLGPVWSGGVSILNHDLTHRTSGFPNEGDSSIYPAFDDGWMAGRYVIAPEDMLITKIGGAQGGVSVYATGSSKIRYWFGHVDLPLEVGTPVNKGQRFAIIANIEVDHVHVGIDTRALIGHELLHHTDYSHGAALVGRQISEALSLGD